MRGLITIALSVGVVVTGSGALAAQGTPAARPRAFANVFTTPSPAPEVPPALTKAVRKALRTEMQRWQKVLSAPRGGKCHMIVVPADPFIDPHFSVAPQSTTRFLLREERTDHVCR